MSIFGKELINVSHSVGEQVNMPNHNESFHYHSDPPNAGVTAEVAYFNCTVPQNNKCETTIFTFPFLSEYFLQLQTMIQPKLTSEQ